MRAGPLRVAIAGCGLIGQRRAKTVSDAVVVACADLVEDRARRLASAIPGCQAFVSWQDMLGRIDCDVVIVATLHDSLAQIADAAIACGRHVLVEKPAGRRAAELVPVADRAAKAGLSVRVGFNHRYHRALRQARQLVDQGALGDLMFVRGLYGHGGRIGYDREWRADPALSGGGELIDQGPHLVDLARWFLGDFTKVQGYAGTFFWDMAVDDNGFMLLRTADDKTAFLHASCTEWKNMFSFELYGKLGKLHVTGLGGSYGVERLAYYKMLPEMGPPETTIWEYPMQDDSWNAEFADFVRDIRAKRPSSPGMADAIAVLRVIEAVYSSSR